MAYSDQEIHEQLAGIISAETGVERADPRLDSTLENDLAVDSLSLMTIIVIAEEQFGVRIPDEGIGDLSTLEDLVRLVIRHQA